MSWYYGVAKPPVCLPDRKGPFTCIICHRPGWGALNSRVHPGKCREQHTRELAARNAERRRERLQVMAV